MGLYLCVFEGENDDVEIDGVEVGGYDDFHTFRTAVNEQLETVGWGSRFPILMNHRDSDGIWTPDEAGALELELRTIAEEMRRLPPVELPQGWRRETAHERGLKPMSLTETFFDIDGEPLLDRLVELARVAVENRQPIWFQ
jgi:hypothetical protein